jgi:uncharacterized protein (DUF983 family)
MHARPLMQSLTRGWRGRCPACGDGPLFHRYLKVDPRCDACDHDNGRYPADDAPPYFTMLLVGHLVVAPMLAFPFIWTWPAWAVLSLTLPVLAVLTLALLPRVKGAVIAYQYAVGVEAGRGPEAP